VACIIITTWLASNPKWRDVPNKIFSFRESDAADRDWVLCVFPRSHTARWKWWVCGEGEELAKELQYERWVATKR